MGEITSFNNKIIYLCVQFVNHDIREDFFFFFFFFFFTICQINYSYQVIAACGLEGHDQLGLDINNVQGGWCNGESNMSCEQIGLQIN